jgi:methionine-rich copper-binding protein CopC
MRYLPRSLGAATGAVLLALLILPVVALAHANFVRSTPAANSVVAGVKSQIPCKRSGVAVHAAAPAVVGGVAGAGAVFPRRARCS